MWDFRPTQWPCAFALLAVVAFAGCGDDDERTQPIEVAVTEGCGLLQQRSCLLPFPSNAYTVADAAMDSGRRLAFAAEHAPETFFGERADLREWNRSDGFSPGSPILVFAPGVDLVASRAASLVDLEHSISDDSAVLIIDADSGRRHPHWVEVDAQASGEDDRLLIIRPAANFADGHSYVVAIRGLVDGSGESLPVSEVFAAYRDGVPTTSPSVENQRPRMERVFAVAQRAGMRRDELWLAWDFTIASTRSLSERALAMSDDSLARLGEGAPIFRIDEVQQAGGGVRNRTSHYVYGGFEVPNYLQGDGAPGSRLHYGEDGLPAVNPENPVFEARFACILPAPSVGAEGEPARAVVYGHGLLGSRFEVVEAWDIVLMSSEHNMVYCATDWVGMTFDDAGVIGTGLGNITNFPKTPDRLQQGFVNINYLARLMTHANGFVSNEAFRSDGRPVIDTSDVFYDGNSQGGILGAAATALATEWSRAVLGVPGMNFSTLLDRSRAFLNFRPVIDTAYPNALERQIVLALMQMVWDRGEANGYANHLGDRPLPGRSEHRVLLHVALGDFQVADVTAFVEARSFGAAVHRPATANDRVGIDYAFDLPAIDYPWSGSAVVLWDSGVPLPPLGNVPPDGAGDALGRHDPHEDPRYDADVRLQKSEFLRSNGAVIDVCDGPCTADRYG